MVADFNVLLSTSSYTYKLSVLNQGGLALKYHFIKSESPNLHVHPGFNAIQCMWYYVRNMILLLGTLLYKPPQFRSPPFKSTLSAYWAGSVQIAKLFHTFHSEPIHVVCPARCQGRLVIGQKNTESVSRCIPGNRKTCNKQKENESK